MELVSVIITTHNRCMQLKNAIASVLNQTYKNIELIVVDDASTDDTSAWMSNAENSRVKYIYISPAESKGGNHARNIGIAESKGNYIALLDDDDTWENTKIEKQMQVMLSSDDVCVVYCGRKIIYSDSTVVYRMPKSRFRGNLSEKVFTYMFATSSMLLLRKESVIEAGKFDEELKYWQDYDLLIRLCQKGKVLYVDEPLANISAMASDPARLSNQLNGWNEAVQYINRKYDGQIKQLSRTFAKEREAMIFTDGAGRCLAAGDMEQRREYLRKAFFARPTFKRLLKCIIQIPPYRLFGRGGIRTSRKEVLCSKFIHEAFYLRAIESCDMMIVY